MEDDLTAAQSKCCCLYLGRNDVGTFSGRRFLRTERNLHYELRFQERNPSSFASQKSTATLLKSLGPYSCLRNLKRCDKQRRATNTSSRACCWRRPCVDETGPLTPSGRAGTKLSLVEERSQRRFETRDRGDRLVIVVWGLPCVLDVGGGLPEIELIIKLPRLFSLSSPHRVLN